jgi:hypothetical protein
VCCCRLHLQRRLGCHRLSYFWHVPLKVVYVAGLGFMIHQLLPGCTPVQFPRLSRRDDGGYGPMARPTLPKSSLSFTSESTYSVSSPHQRPKFQVSSTGTMPLRSLRLAHDAQSKLFSTARVSPQDPTKLLGENLRHIFTERGIVFF